MHHIPKINQSFVTLVIQQKKILYWLGTKTSEKLFRYIGSSKTNIEKGAALPCMKTCGLGS